MFLKVKLGKLGGNGAIFWPRFFIETSARRTIKKASATIVANVTSRSYPNDVLA